MEQIGWRAEAREVRRAISSPTKPSNGSRHICRCPRATHHHGRSRRYTLRIRRFVEYIQRYLAWREKSGALDDAIFISERKAELKYSTVRAIFLQLVRSIGLRGCPGRRGPCIHDLRHSLAVRALESCGHEEGEIARHILALSTYLGHAHPRAAVLIVTVDHGEEFKEHAGMLHGFTLYDESVVVPLILLAPGHEGGQVVDQNLLTSSTLRPPCSNCSAWRRSPASRSVPWCRS